VALLYPAVAFVADSGNWSYRHRFSIEP
jgi:hypothetical protein